MKRNFFIREIVFYEFKKKSKEIYTEFISENKNR